AFGPVLNPPCSLHRSFRIAGETQATPRRFLVPHRFTFVMSYGAFPSQPAMRDLRKVPINRNAWATRVFGAEGSNRSGSFTWAGKQEKLRSMQLCYFLTSPFVELTRNRPFGCAITTELQNKCLNEEFDPAAQRSLADFQPVPELRRRGR